MARLALLVALLQPPHPYQEVMRRFPDEAVTSECLSLSCRYLESARARQAFLPRPWSDDADEDVLSGQWCKECWDKLNDYRQWKMRSAAGELREMLGDRLFFEGRMPPPVPLWRFRSVD